MKADRFRSLASLLEEGLAVGVLASAIESHGVHGWDRYGRFKRFSKESDNAKDALDALAEIAKRDEVPTMKAEIYKKFPGFSAPWHNYGWLTDALPDLQALSATNADAPEKPERSAKGVNADLTLIGALLLVIEGEYGFKKHPDYETRTQFVNLLDARFNGEHGLSTSTLFRKFKKARDQLG